MTANALPTRSTIAATINKVFIILCLRQQIDLCLSYLDECTLNARHTRASLKLLFVGWDYLAYPTTYFKVGTIFVAST
jgi:hypothetical protein